MFNLTTVKLIKNAVMYDKWELRRLNVRRLKHVEKLQLNSMIYQKLSRIIVAQLELVWPSG